jgi:tetratricopeptide (TPR) repeat protein
MRIGIVRSVGSGDRGLDLALVVALSAALAAAVYAPRARAQSDDERARTHFEAGSSYYDQARYDDASREFEQAYALSGRPELLLNASQAHERALHYDAAIAAAERYLAVVPNAADRRTIEDRIENLRALKQRYEQGGAPAPLPAPGSLPASADPGVAGVATGAAVGSAAQPSAQPSAATSAPEAPSAAPASATAAAERANPLTIPAIVLMGVGGASLVASLVTGLVAHGHYTSLERQCDADGLCPPEARDELDEGETLATTSTVLAIFGVIAAGAGGALLYVGARRGADEGAQARPATPRRFALGAGPTPLSLQGTLKF